MRWEDIGYYFISDQIPVRVGEDFKEKLEVVASMLEARARRDQLPCIYVKLVWNHRLRTSAGRLRSVPPKHAANPQWGMTIELNKKYLDEFGVERVKWTVRHELAHLIERIIHGKGGHSKSWRSACRQLGGSMAHNHAGQEANVSRDAYITTPRRHCYICPGCGTTFYRAKKAGPKTLNHRACGRCKTPANQMSYKYLEPITQEN